jgi:hypothetical protein
VSEVYGIVASTNLTYTLSQTLAKITNQLGLLIIPIIVCIDSYLLYECLIKLSITKEKQLMIDIIAFC